MTVHTHLSDATLQQLALHPQECDAHTTEHLTHCAACQAKWTAYQLVCTGIGAQPPASFDFDVAALVMQQLPAPRPATANRNGLVWLLTGVALIIMGILLYLLRSFIADPVTGQWPLFLFFAAPIAIALVVLHMLETHKRYQQQLNDLNFY